MLYIIVVVLGMLVPIQTAANARMRMQVQSVWVVTLLSFSVSTLALRFLTQQGIIAIPKTVHPARMRENLDSLSFDLTPEELQQISTLDTGRSLFIWW